MVADSLPVTYGCSARHPSSLQDSGQSVGCWVVTCKSLVLSEKSLPLIFLTPPFGVDVGGGAGRPRSASFWTSTRIPDYAQNL